MNRVSFLFYEGERDINQTLLYNQRGTLCDEEIQFEEGMYANSDDGDLN